MYEPTERSQNFDYDFLAFNSWKHIWNFAVECWSCACEVFVTESVYWAVLDRGSTYSGESKHVSVYDANTCSFPGVITLHNITQNFHDFLDP